MEDTEAVLAGDQDLTDALRRAAPADVISVEYFHIYLDEEIGERHNASIQQLQVIEANTMGQCARIVMIDDYTVGPPAIDESDVLEHLSGKDAAPDCLAYESRLIPQAPALLHAVSNRRLCRSYERYVASNGRYPCSLLTAVWYVIRLGGLRADGVIRPLSADPWWPAALLVNVLPADLDELEGRALELIASSPFSSYLPRIRNVFYSAPLASAPRLCVGRF